MTAAAGSKLRNFFAKGVPKYYHMSTLYGIGFSMLSQTGWILGSYYFEKKRGIVNGIIHSGMGLGSLMFSPLTAYMLKELGLSGTFYILGGIALQGVVCGAAIISPNRALRLKLYHQHHSHHHNHHWLHLPFHHNHHHDSEGKVHHQTRRGFFSIFDAGVKFITSAAHIGHLKSEEHHGHHPALDILMPAPLLRPIFGMVDRYSNHVNPGFFHHIRTVAKKSVDLNLFSQPAYALFALSSLLFRFSDSAPITFLPARAISFGHTTEESSFLFISFGMSTILGRIAYGIVADIPRLRCHRIYVYMSAFLICGLSTAVNFGEQLYHQIIYAGIYGFFLGGTNSIRYTVLADLIGLQSLPAGAGMLSALEAVASLLGLSSAAWIYEATGGYEVVYAVAGSLFTAAGVVLLLIPCVQKVQKWCQSHRVQTKRERTTPSIYEAVKTRDENINDQQK